MTTTAERLKQALDIRNMKAIDLHNATKINKSSISQYMNGTVNPKQDRIYLMARALNVNELWLMGHNVPMERTPVPPPPAYPESAPTSPAGQQAQPAPSYYHDPEVAAIANEMKENPGIRALLDASRGLKKESIEEVRRFIEFQKAKELGDWD